MLLLKQMSRLILKKENTFYATIHRVIKRSWKTFTINLIKLDIQCLFQQNVAFAINGQFTRRYLSWMANYGCYFYLLNFFASLFCFGSAELKTKSNSLPQAKIQICYKVKLIPWNLIWVTFKKLCETCLMKFLRAA